MQVDSDALVTLAQESLEQSQSISKLELAASELYKALQAGRDTGPSLSVTLGIGIQRYTRHCCYYGTTSRISHT